MIPPCDPTILDKNPQFKKLHQHLTTNLLSPNGTTRADEADHARKAVAEELRGLQIRSAKRDILKNATRRVALDSHGGLPKDLQDNHAIIALFLDSTTATAVSDEDATSLLERDIEMFLNNVHVLAAHISENVALDIEALRSIADETTNSMVDNPSNRPRKRTRPSSFNNNNARRNTAQQQPQLSSQLTDRTRQLRELQISTLPAARRQMAVTAAGVLAARAQVIERTVVLLERTKHGVLSRATKAQADHLATVAEGMNGKAQVMKLEALTTIYTPETTAALEDYRKHLRDTHARLEETQNIAVQTLEEYERVGAQLGKDGQLVSGPMADIARRYGALTKEVEAVRADMSRLRM
ncbi:uncharacterized protein TRUGW13939_02754 [Talaromyces rugulosus]|uniref:Uncharacterized protein n=1 Tax=Talaromyces rugulosus TaxID=121627 RepID=A0A7H8QNW0_TALRU|nr:uncharacterized protein TRUGW13939_02754 [Talaromyces rugulosus]QKX55657.1 hypothetical protein TRUGW13939_02754 [Talaromyces rugulosus]